jgi:hypothetical protein
MPAVAWSGVFRKLASNLACHGFWLILVAEMSRPTQISVYKPLTLAF